jgi:hypothetical protein
MAAITKEFYLPNFKNNVVVDTAGGVDLTQGNIIYVPINGNIETYVSNATAGDTLILAAGTYTITDDIDIAQAINIVGQGVGQTTITCSTDTKNVFDISSDNVRIANLSISNTSTSGTMRAINVNGSGGSVFTNVMITNVKITTNNSGGTGNAILYDDAGGQVRDVVIVMSGAGSANYGIMHRNNSTAEATTTLNVYNADVTITAGTTIYGYYSTDNTSAQDNFMYVFNSRSTVSGGTTNNAAYVSNGDAFIYLENCVLNGATYDIRNVSAGGAQLRNCTLVNGTSLGTITLDGFQTFEDLGQGTYNKDITIDGSGTNSLINNKSGSGCIHFDGTTASTRIYHTMSQNVATSDISMSCTFRVPTANPTSTIGLFGLSSSSSVWNVASAFGVYISTSGNLVVAIYNVGGTSHNREATVNSIISNYGGKIINVVFVRSTASSTMNVYINGVLQTTTEATGGTDPTWAGSITSTNVIIGTRSSTQLFNDRIYSVKLFNRALSQAEVCGMREVGSLFADQWGNMTNQTSGTLTVGKRYLINSFVAGDDFTNVGGTNVTGNEFIATGTTPTTWTNSSSLNRIGIMCDPDLENYDQNQGTYVHDRSTNIFAGTATAAGLTQMKNINRTRNLSVYAAGTAYQLTNTSAKLDFGTTDPSLTITAPGTWLINAKARLDYNAATFAANRTVTLKLRRTNNTAADVTNSSTQSITGIVTTITQTYAVIQLPAVFYTTSNSNDVLEIWGDVSVVPSAGSLDAVEANITATRLY